MMNTIKKILKRQGRTQKWLSEKIDKSYVAVTNYCNNNTQPTIPVMRQSAKVGYSSSASMPRISVKQK